MKKSWPLLLVTLVTSGCASFVATNGSDRTPRSKVPEIQQKSIRLSESSQAYILPTLCMEVGLWLSFEVPSNDDQLKIIGCQRDNSSQRALMFQIYGRELKMLWSRELETQASKMIELLETI